MSREAVVHEGWIKKEGAPKTVFGLSFLRSYKDRYFILRDTQLSYYKEKPEVGRRVHPAGVIDLYKTVVEELPSNRITIAGSQLTRKYILQAASREDQARWYHILSEVASRTAVSLSDFKLERLVGEGGFGSVYKVQCRTNGKVYAMKVIEKKRLARQADIQGVMDEKKFMQSLNHPFIVKLHYTFQTSDKLYMIMDFLSGGECYYLMTQQRFPESTVRLYAAQIALALDYLHAQGILYRDLKPENCVLDAEGNMVLTDFGLSKKTVSGGPRRTRVGTPDYWAPEMVKGEEYGKGIDYWALGCLIFEMITGRHPFLNALGQVPARAAVEEEPQLDGVAVPVSPECKGIVREFLIKDPARRLQEFARIQAHPWFATTDWEKVYRKEIKPAWTPPADDRQNFDPDFTQKAPVLKPSEPGQHISDFTWSASSPLGGRG